MLEINNLTKTYGKKVVLDDVSLSLSAGELVALVGPNGVGKSTLMNLIANLEKADSGSILINGQSNQSTAIFADLSVMLGAESLYPQLTAYDHLSYIAYDHQLKMTEVVDLIDCFGMTSYAKKRVGTYSLGMKQKLLFAMAVLPKPRLLLLDEPHIGLDPSNIIFQREMILKLNQEGTTILLSSHHLSEIEQLTSKIVFIRKGKLEVKKLGYLSQTGYFLTLKPCSQLKDFLAIHPEEAKLLEDNSLWLSENSLLDFFKHVSPQQVISLEKASDRLEKIYRNLYLKRGNL